MDSLLLSFAGDIAQRTNKTVLSSAEDGRTDGETKRHGVIRTMMNEDTYSGSCKY